MDKEKPSEQVLASPTLNPNSGKPTASPRETTAVSLTPNVTNARVYTRYVPGTSARIKVAGDDVAALLQKPRGQVSKDEITGMLGKLSRMEAGGEPLQGAEFLNRQSLFMAVVTRGVSEGLLTPQEVTSYRVFNQAAVGAMAMSGGGSKLPGRAIADTGPELARTSAASSRFRGVAVLKRATYNYGYPLNSRHRIKNVKQGGVKKNKNTVTDSNVDMKADVDAINSGQGSRSGNIFEINGRKYELISGDHLVPHSGNGVYNLNRGEFDALGVFNKFGNSPRALEIAEKLAGPEGAKNALRVWSIENP